ncbi:WYL domain-containing protein [Niallia sp. 03133]|uniref:WYL domain-containing protein n=1 Tax=Niallia sp. 03133 TaxID=3458060 RepID=UPI0040450D79
MLDRQLKKAFFEKKPIEIIYEKKNKTFSKRTIFIKEIQSSYVRTYCLTKRQPRIFKIDSIMAAFFRPMEEKKHA